MTSMVLYSAHYNRNHYAFEQFGALCVHNLDDKHSTRPGFETSRAIPLSFEPQPDRMRHRAGLIAGIECANKN